jgi:hypothetical protein
LALARHRGKSKLTYGERGQGGEAKIDEMTHWVFALRIYQIKLKIKSRTDGTSLSLESVIIASPHPFSTLTQVRPIRSRHPQAGSSHGKFAGCYTFIRFLWVS